MKLRPETGLTFDDVLLVPKRSAIRSRKAVSTAVTLAGNIRLHIPILSSNMDTVTEWRMAIAMAQQGGLGVLHRFMPVSRMAEMIRKVKRAENVIVSDPISILATATLDEARQKMAEAEVGGLMVVDEHGKLAGLVTTRDVLLARQDGATPITALMTPRERLVVAGPEESMEDARRLLYEHRIEKLPLVDSQDRVIGLITAQDIIKMEEHPHATKDGRGRLRVGAAVGVRADDLERAAACVQAGADVLVIDVAHGHSDHTIEMVRRLKREFPGVPVIAGNVATAEGVRDLAGAGADAVKVGVGSGSICITRVVTGFGVPQLSAVLECAGAGQKLGVPVISDGGARVSGDLVKALGAGASTVMVGSLLAGTEESPGVYIVREGRRYKVVRGMASLSANVERKKLERGEQITDEDWYEVVPEGVEALVPARGAVSEVIYQLVGGLRSGMSYAGATTVEELWERAEFVRVTGAGMAESGAHDVTKI